MIGLFAIDDHFLILEGLYKTFDPLSDGIGLVGSATDVSEAIVKIPGSETDIIVLDLHIGDTSPVENFMALHEAFPAIPIVILTMEESMRWQRKMFQLGVMAFLNKTEGKDAMKIVFSQVAAGNLVMPQQVSQSLITRPHQPG
jgi:two-component system response regulator DevR